MTALSPLYSPYWYRVASLVPRIPPGTRVQRQVLRGKEWFVLRHPLNGSHHRVNQKAYALIGRLDGEHSLEVLWHGLARLLGDEAPTQDEVIRMVAQLADAGLILLNTEPDWPLQMQQQQAQRVRERRNNLNPLAFRIRLFNPSSLVERCGWLQAVLWHPVTIILALILTSWAVFHAALEWNAIRAFAAVNLLTPRGLAVAWCVYPVMKAVHEFSHALAVQRWGGKVKEAGVGFFLLMPVPYVDASEAVAFPGKWQRVAVGAAGIVTELLLASVAFLIWMATENGIVRDTAFAVMTIGAVSTVVFNANPLVRFDGYYILCDILELPNLATRSQSWWNQLLQQYAGGARSGAETGDARGESIWIFLYAPASWGYRIGISVILVQWIAFKSTLIAFLAMIGLLFSLAIKPVWNAMLLLLGPAHPAAGRKPVLIAASMTAILVAGLCCLSLPVSTVAGGVVWLPEQSQVRTDSDGRVAQILVQDGQHVSAGQPLAVIEEPSLLTKRARLQAQLMGAETEQARGWLNASLGGANGFETTGRLRSELALVDERIEHLTLRAKVDGEVVMPHAGELQGRDVTKGTLLAYVLPGDFTTVRAVITQDDMGRMKSGVRNISVKLAEAGGKTFDARLLRVEPAATTYLPSVALGDKGGGSFVTDPADREGRTSLEPVFLADVQLKDRTVLRTGGRAWVRFEHEAMPLAETVLLRARQLFLRVFSGRSDA